MIPVVIVTGFLGSGKTTLIGRVLRDPAFARTAVVVNVFGDRADASAQPQPFVSMPLVYERAYGGAGVEANPVGRGVEGHGEPPNLIDPLKFGDWSLELLWIHGEHRSRRRSARRYCHHTRRSWTATFLRLANW